MTKRDVDIHFLLTKIVKYLIYIAKMLIDSLINGVFIKFMYIFQKKLRSPRHVLKCGDGRSATGAVFRRPGYLPSAIGVRTQADHVMKNERQHKISPNIHTYIQNNEQKVIFDYC